MFYHKCGRRLEELEKEWKEDTRCPECGEIVKPWRSEIWNTDTIEFVLEDEIEFAD